MNRTNALMFTVILSLVAVVMPGRIFNFDGQPGAPSSGSERTLSHDSARAIVSAEADFSQEWIPARGVTPVTARVRIASPSYSIRDNDPRVPIDLVAILDLSSNLTAEEHRQACLQVVNMEHYLRPGDRLAVIAMGDTLEVVHPLEGADTISRPALDWSHLGLRLTSGASLSGTGLIDALELAEKILNESPDGRRRQVFLFSDGSARTASLDGELLCLGKQFDLRGIAVSAFGLGHDFDVERLIRIASVTGGGYAHVDMDSNGDRLQRAVRDEWGRVVNRTLDNVLIELDLETGVRFIRTLKHEAVVGERHIEILAPTLARGEVRSILLDLEVDAAKIPHSGNRADSLVRIHISYVPSGAGIRNSVGREMLHLALGARIASDNSPRDMRHNPALLAEKESIDADLIWSEAAGRLRFGAVAYDGVATILCQKAEELEHHNQLFRSPVVVEEISALQAAARRIQDRSFYFGSAFGEATFGQDKAAIAAGEYQ